LLAAGNADGQQIAYTAMMASQRADACRLVLWCGDRDDPDLAVGTNADQSVACGLVPLIWFYAAPGVYWAATARITFTCSELTTLSKSSSGGMAANLLALKAGSIR
jgi:hypothetical protein